MQYRWLFRPAICRLERATWLSYPTAKLEYGEQSDSFRCHFGTSTLDLLPQALFSSPSNCKAGNCPESSSSRSQADPTMT